MHVAIDHAFILLFKVGEVADVYQVVNEDEYSDIVGNKHSFVLTFFATITIYINC